MYVIRFEGVDAADVAGIYGAFVAGELDEVDIAMNSDVDFEKGTITHDGNVDTVSFIDIFNGVCMGIISENTEATFKMYGRFEDGLVANISCEYSNDCLELKQEVSGETKNISFELENGLFDDDDGVEFSCFFDI